MITELWHHWGLLRPLFVFVLAGPLIVLAALPRRHGQPRGRKTHSAVSTVSIDTLQSTAGHSPVTDTDETGDVKAGSVYPVAPGDIREGSPAPESERCVEASPHEWRGGGDAPDRRAA